MKETLKRWLLFFQRRNKNGVPYRLSPYGRMVDQLFLETEKLYHSYDLSDYDFIEDSIKLETIRFPDFSCNWGKYSEPADVRHRENGNKSDGCYSFTVKTSKYKSYAAPAHDPLDDLEYPNYSHTEIRLVKESHRNNFVSIPPKKSDVGKIQKAEYRQYLANSIHFDIRAKD